MRFQDRVVMVTGATSGIGGTCARQLAAEGAKVVACGRRQDRLAGLVKEWSAAGRELLPLEGDVRDEATCARWVKATVERFGGLDALINAAGVLGNGSALDTATPDWDRLMDSNLRSLFLMTRAAGPELIRKQGAVVNLSSVASHKPYAGRMP